MHQRLEKLLGKAGQMPLATTFHAFCIKVLQDVEKISSFRVIDEIERKYYFELAADTIRKSPVDVGVKMNELSDRAPGAEPTM